MKHAALASIYIAFFTLIGFACYFTSSAMPLWALLLTPTYKNKTDGDDE